MIDLDQNRRASVRVLHGVTMTFLGAALIWNRVSQEGIIDDKRSLIWRWHDGALLKLTKALLGRACLAVEYLPLSLVGVWTWALYLVLFTIVVLFCLASGV